MRKRKTVEDWLWEKRILVMKWLLEMILEWKFLSQAIELPEIGEEQPH